MDTKYLECCVDVHWLWSDATKKELSHCETETIYDYCIALLFAMLHPRSVLQGTYHKLFSKCKHARFVILKSERGERGMITIELEAVTSTSQVEKRGVSKKINF